MNATSSTTLLQNLFEIKIEEVETLIAEGALGSEGIRVFPYFNGERMPPLPHARAVMKGLSFDNFTRANLMRAMAESVAFSLKWGFEKISRRFGMPSQFRLTGGGANSAAWRRPRPRRSSIYRELYEEFCGMLRMEFFNDREEAIAIGQALNAKTTLNPATDPSPNA